MTLKKIGNEKESFRKMREVSQGSTSSIWQSAKPSREESPETLKRRIKELEKQLSNAEMRAEAYKTMIEVAESMGMPVRKKAGVKQ